MAKRERIDELLVQHDLAEDRDEAARLLMAGLVVADDHRVDKPGEMVSVSAVVRLKHHNKFASRGGLKLEKAVAEYGIDFSGKSIIDIGASTGGFTDVALQNGAGRVFSVDTGRGQLDPRLARDEKVTVLDDTNFRTIEYETIGIKADIFVCDVSFISLKKIFPACVQFCRDGSEGIFLIKPQFEAQRHEVDRGGIVRDADVRRKVIAEVLRSAEDNGFYVAGLCTSPIKGAKGNIEYLAYFVYNDNDRGTVTEDIIDRVVDEEYSYHSQTARG